MRQRDVHVELCSTSNTREKRLRMFRGWEIEISERMQRGKGKFLLKADQGDQVHSIAGGRMGNLIRYGG